MEIAKTPYKSVYVVVPKTKFSKSVHMEEKKATGLIFNFLSPK